MKKSKLILLMLAILIVVAGKTNGQDGSEYLLWEKTKDFTTVDVAFSPDETHIAVSAEYTDTYPHTYSIKILSVQTGEELYSIKVPHLAWPLTYSPDGKYLVEEGNGNEVLFFETKTYTLVKEIPSGIISFTADSKLFSKTASGYKFRLYNSETFENVFEQSLVQPESDETGSLDVFFTPNGKYIMANSIFSRKAPYSGTRIVQEIFDAKTYQKINKTINCLKNPGSFSNNGLIVNTFPKEGSSSTQPIGFRIYDYDKDSLIWEQETGNTGMLRFINSKNYLFTCYQPGLGWKVDFWDLDKKKLRREYDSFKNNLYFEYGSNISKNDSYLVHGGGEFAPIRLYDFGKFLEEAVSVKTIIENKGISIFPNPTRASLTIELSDLSTSVIYLKLFDNTGKIICTIFSGIPKNKFIEYGTARLSKGIYFVRYETKSDSISKKIIIE